MIYIIGHTKPDLDSAASVVALKYLFDKAKCFGYGKAVPVLADPANFETKTIFKKFHSPLPQVLKSEQIKQGDVFILADHNEESQRLPGIKNEQIVDIFDHHKVNLNLNKPIFITIKPWGSTSTLAYWLMEIVNLQPKKNLAALMIAAILSDTVGLQSATTTEKDREVLKKLNQIAQIKDRDKLTLEIFKAKSSLKGLNIKQILIKDYKLYDFADKKVLINQIETVEQKKLIEKSVQLIKGLVKIKKEMGLNYVFCVITDVLKINSQVIISPGDEKILTQAFPLAKRVKSGVYDIGPLMSRKKEIAPPIEKAVI
jgi:manganese-dependent inorganic pyrophosphatase